MAAFTGTPTGSLQYNDQQTAQMADPVIGRGKLEVMPFKYTHTATEGSGTGEVNLVTLPPGLIRVFVDLCRMVTSAFATSADIHVGHRAHVTMAGAAVAVDDNSLLDNADAASGVDLAFGLPAVGFLDFDSDVGVVLYSLIDAGNIEAADTIDGYVVYSQGG